MLLFHAVRGEVSIGELSAAIGVLVQPQGLGFTVEIPPGILAVSPSVSDVA